MVSKRFSTARAAMALLLFVSANAAADGLRADIIEMLAQHKRVEAAKLDLEAAKQRSTAAGGAWYPTLDATTSYGWEDQNKGQGSDDTSMPPRVLELSLTQLIWDFGATNAAIDRSKIEVTQAQQTLESTRQNVALEGVNAWFNVVRQRKLLQFNGGSVDNVKRQMQLEDARVQRGSGLATDVLQAKSQLAGLDATNTRLKGALRTAVNRYRAVFSGSPPELTPANMKLPKPPLEILPATVDEAVAIAMEENPRLKATYLGTLIAGTTVTETKANGEVVNVSPDTIDTQDGIPYYKVRVETEANQFESGAVIYELVPGVQVACAIRTGQRSVLAYLLDPVMSSVQTALRER